MRGKILLITIIAAIDAFLVFFAIGFNSKHALVEDPSLPPVDMEQVRKSVEERERAARPKVKKTVNVDQGGAAKPAERKKLPIKSKGKKTRTRSK